MPNPPVAPVNDAKDDAVHSARKPLRPCKVAVVCAGMPCVQETQTKPEGQIHFFPIIFNGQQLYDVMVERCGPSQNSGPK